MSLPTDQFLTKYRIKLERNAIAIKEMEKRHLEEMQELRSIERNIYKQYFDRIEELGYCCSCEKPLAQCAGHPAYG